MIAMNEQGAAFAEQLVSYDAVDAKSDWAFAAADGMALLGDTENWIRYGKCFLGEDRDYDATDPRRYVYPFAKYKGEQIMLFRSAVVAIRDQTTADNVSAISQFAGRLLDKMDRNRESNSSGVTKMPKTDENQDTPSQLSMAALARIDVKAQVKDEEAEEQEKGKNGKAAEDKDGGNQKGTTPLPTFSMVANNGTPMRLEGFKHPVVMDLDGMNIPSQSRPIRFQHDPQQGVGHTNSIGMEGGSLVARGVISRNTPAAREIIDSAKNGFPWQASVGASIQKNEFVRPGDKAMVNGQEYEGPLNVVRQSRLGEISFVDIGADEATSARVAAAGVKNKDGEDTKTQFGDDMEATDQIIHRAKAERVRQAGIRALVEEALTFRGANIQVIEQVSADALDSDWSVKDTELALLRATRPRAPAVLRRADAPTPQMLEASLCLAMGISDERLAKDLDYGPEVVQAAWPMRHRGLRGTICAALEAAGVRIPHGSRELFQAILEHQHIRAEGFSTINLPGILGNVANKVLLDAFILVDVTYDRAAEQADFSNFQTHSIYRLQNLGDFTLVGGDGELKHSNLGQDSYSNKLDTRGTILTITRQDIINDDLNAFRSLTQQLARKARLAAEKALYTAMMEVTDSFYTTARGNRLVGAIGIASLGAAEAALLNMTDANGDPIYAMPRYIVVPPQLKFFADQIFTSPLVNDFTASQARPTDNPFRGRFEVLSSPFLASAALSGSSATTWYLVANPLILPAFQIAYLDGRRAPTIETADAVFDTLGLQMRCYWDFGLAALDYRGAIKNTAT